jgi:two-component system nitrate/nitrite response regulator NarL
MLSEKQAGNTGGQALGKIRIAIADDHPIFRDALCRILSFEPDLHVVAQVDDGMEVLKAIDRWRPDILLLDLNMPGLGGLSTLQKLREANTQTRVILLTASDDRDQFVSALKLGSCGIVQKQTATHLLIDSIRLVHAGELWMDSRSTATVIQGVIPPGDAPGRITHQTRHRPSLSRRETEIVRLVVQGFKNADIAESLSISEQTVKNHLYRIFEKWDVSDRLELALYAIDQKLFGNF